MNKVSQTEMLLAALKRGERLTLMDSLSKYGCLSLSQRMTPLIRAGLPIHVEMVKVGPHKKRVAMYSWHGSLELFH